MARKCNVLFERDPKDNIRVTVSVDTQDALTEDEIRNDPMLSLVYRCLEPVFPYIKSEKKEKEDE